MIGKRQRESQSLARSVGLAAQRFLGRSGEQIAHHRVRRVRDADLELDCRARGGTEHEKRIEAGEAVQQRVRNRRRDVAFGLREAENSGALVESHQIGGDQIRDSAGGRQRRRDRRRLAVVRNDVDERAERARPRLHELRCCLCGIGRQMDRSDDREAGRLLFFDNRRHRSRRRRQAVDRDRVDVRTGACSEHAGFPLDRARGNRALYHNRRRFDGAQLNGREFQQIDVTIDVMLVTRRDRADLICGHGAAATFGDHLEELTPRLDVSIGGWKRPERQ